MLTILPFQAIEGKDLKEVMTNIGSVGPAAAAAPAAAAGGAAEPAAEEKKEEGNDQGYPHATEFTVTNSKQRRRSPMRTWASASSTKRVLRSAFRFLFPFSPPTSFRLRLCT